MKKKEITLRQQLEAFERGEILAYSGETGEAGCWNFYDWFCRDECLKAKAEKLMGYVKRFVKAHPELDLDKHKAWFKNNCPIGGPLYDDIRISSLGENSKNVWIMTAKTRYTKRAKLYHCSNYEKPILYGETFADLLLPVEVPIEE